MCAQTRSSTGTELADRIKSILGLRNLNLHSVSLKSESTFGHASPYVLPHNLYYELRAGTFSPSLRQLFALSKITNHRIVDWLRVFGVDLEEIPRLQALLPAKRTVLLDTTVADPNGWVPWFRNRPNVSEVPPVAPLSQLLEIAAPVRQSLLLEMNKPHFLYAKIGCEDALAFPDLVPGSIVRINSSEAGVFIGKDRKIPNRIFAVEHARGLFCCRFLPGTKNSIRLVSPNLPYAQVELQLHREARILGAVDLEIRPLVHTPRPEVPNELARRWKPEQLPRDIPRLNRLLRSARARAGLPLREASALSRRIAKLLNDERYFLSSSSLSDYEAGDTMPRHLHKIFSLCLAYSVHFRTLCRIVGLPEEDAGAEPIPDGLMQRSRPSDAAITVPPAPAGGFLGELFDRWGDVPIFLKGAIADVSHVRSPSLRSFFWLGGIDIPVHPYLEHAFLASVDWQRKRPADSRSRPLWEQSLYIVLKRDGNYLCGPCGLENGDLVLHPDPEHLHLREELRNRRDAEVVGQVCALVRRL